MKGTFSIVVKSKGKISQNFVAFSEYMNFNTTISSFLGATTIRAFKQDQRFTLESEIKVDANVRCNYYNYCSNRWLAIRIEILGNVIVFFAALFCIIDRENLTPGKAGLSISYAMQVTDTLTWMVRVFHIPKYSQT